MPSIRAGKSIFVPDHVMLQGTLASSGAPISIFVRYGKTFPDEPAAEWRVCGAKGEIRFTSQGSLGLTLGGEKLEFHDHEKDLVETINVDYEDAVKDLPNFAKNMGRLYELFVKGESIDEGFVDFGQGLKMHEILNKMENSWKGKKFEKVSG